jgi:hypothetical protein
MDAVWLGSTARFNNGFVFEGCIFRNCSFQRITLFASIENFNLWNDNPSLNWIGIPPTDADIEARHHQIAALTQPSLFGTQPQKSADDEPKPI